MGKENRREYWSLNMVCCFSVFLCRFVQTHSVLLAQWSNELFVHSDRSVLFAVFGLFPIQTLHKVFDKEAGREARRGRIQGNRKRRAKRDFGSDSRHLEFVWWNCVVQRVRKILYIGRKRDSSERKWRNSIRGRICSDIWSEYRILSSSSKSFWLFLILDNVDSRSFQSHSNHRRSDERKERKWKGWIVLVDRMFDTKTIQSNGW